MTQARDLADGKFDTNTLVVDAANNRVGIREASPAAPLHVSTAASTTAEIRLTSNNTGSGSGDRGRIAVYSTRNDGTAYESGRIDIDRSSGTESKAHIQFFTNDGSGASERLRILSGGGLTFNGDTSDVNALDDYEEGSWTPTLTREGGTLSVSYSEQRGRYTKVGRIVCAQFRLQANITGTDTGARFMTGLPYANVNAGGDTGSGSISPFGGFGGQNFYSVSGHMVNNSASFRFKVQANLDQAGTDWSGGTGNVVMDGSFIYVSTS